MSNIDTFNLLLTAGIILLIVMQLVLLIVAFIIVLRIKKTVTTIKGLADSGEEIVREIADKMKRQASVFSMVSYLVKRGMKLRKEVK